MTNKEIEKEIEELKKIVKKLKRKIRKLEDDDDHKTNYMRVTPTRRIKKM